MASRDSTTPPVQDILALKQKPPTPKQLIQNVGAKKDDLTELGKEMKRADLRKKEILIWQWREQRVASQQVDTENS